MLSWYTCGDIHIKKPDTVPTFSRSSTSLLLAAALIVQLLPAPVATLAADVTGGQALQSTVTNSFLGNIAIRANDTGVEYFDDNGIGGVVGRLYNSVIGVVSFDRNGVPGTQTTVVGDWGVTVTSTGQLRGQMFNEIVGFIDTWRGTGNPTCSPTPARNPANFGLCLANGNREIVGEVYSDGLRALATRRADAIGLTGAARTTFIDDASWIRFAGGATQFNAVDAKLPATIDQLSRGAAGSTQERLVDALRTPQEDGTTATLTRTALYKDQTAMWLYCQNGSTLQSLTPSAPVVLTNQEWIRLGNQTLGQTVRIDDFPSLAAYNCASGNFKLLPALRYSATIDNVASRNTPAAGIPSISGRAELRTPGEIAYCRMQVINADTGELIADQSSPANPLTDVAANPNNPLAPQHPQVGQRLLLRFSGMRDAAGNPIAPQSIDDLSFVPQGKVAVGSALTDATGAISITPSDTLQGNGKEITGSTNQAFLAGTPATVRLSKNGSIPWEMDAQGQIAFNLTNIDVNGRYRLALGLRTGSGTTQLPGGCGTLDMLVVQSQQFSCPVVQVNSNEYQSPTIPGCNAPLSANVAPAGNRLTAPLQVEAGSGTLQVRLRELKDASGNSLPSPAYTLLKVELLRDRTQGHNVEDASFSEPLETVAAMQLPINNGSVNATMTYPYKAGEYRVRYAYCASGTPTTQSVNDAVAAGNCTGVATTPQLMILQHTAPASAYAWRPDIFSNVESARGGAKAKLPVVTAVSFTKAPGAPAYTVHRGTTPDVAAAMAGTSHTGLRVENVTDRYGNYLRTTRYPVGVRLIDSAGAQNDNTNTPSALPMANNNGVIVLPASADPMLSFPAGSLTRTGVYFPRLIYPANDTYQIPERTLEIQSRWPVFTGGAAALPTAQFTFTTAGPAISNAAPVPQAVAGRSAGKLDLTNIKDEYGNLFTPSHGFLSGAAGIYVRVINQRTRSRNIAAYRDGQYRITQFGSPMQTLTGPTLAGSLTLPAFTDYDLRLAGEYEYEIATQWSATNNAANLLPDANTLTYTGDTSRNIFELWPGSPELPVDQTICSIARGNAAGCVGSANGVMGTTSFTLAEGTTGQSYPTLSTGSQPWHVGVAGLAWPSTLRVIDVTDRFGNAVTGNNIFITNGVVTNMVKLHMRLQQSWNESVAGLGSAVSYTDALPVQAGVLELPGSTQLQEAKWVLPTALAPTTYDIARDTAFIFAGDYRLELEPDNATGIRLPAAGAAWSIVNNAISPERVMTTVNNRPHSNFTTGIPLTITLYNLADQWGNWANYIYKTDATRAAVLAGNNVVLSSLSQRIFLPTNPDLYSGAGLATVGASGTAAVAGTTPAVGAGVPLSFGDFPGKPGVPFISIAVPATSTSVAGLYDIAAGLTLRKLVATPTGATSFAEVADASQKHDRATLQGSSFVQSLQGAGYNIDAPHSAGALSGATGGYTFSLSAHTPTTSDIRALSSFNDASLAYRAPYIITDTNAPDEYYDLLLQLRDAQGNGVLPLTNEPIYDTNGITTITVGDLTVTDPLRADSIGPDKVAAAIAVGAEASGSPMGFANFGAAPNFTAGMPASMRLFWGYNANNLRGITTAGIPTSNWNVSHLRWHQRLYSTKPTGSLDTDRQYFQLGWRAGKAGSTVQQTATVRDNIYLTSYLSGNTGLNSGLNFLPRTAQPGATCNDGMDNNYDLFTLSGGLLTGNWNPAGGIDYAGIYLEDRNRDGKINIEDDLSATNTPLTAAQYAAVLSAAWQVSRSLGCTGASCTSGGRTYLFVPSDPACSVDPSNPGGPGGGACGTYGCCTGTTTPKTSAADACTATPPLTCPDGTTMPTGGNCSAHGGPNVGSPTASEGSPISTVDPSNSAVYYKDPSSSRWGDLRFADILLRRNSTETFRALIQNHSAKPINIADIDLSALPYDPKVIERLKQGLPTAGVSDSILPTRQAYYSENDAKESVDLANELADDITSIRSMYQEYEEKLTERIDNDEFDNSDPAACEQRKVYAWKDTTGAYPFASPGCEITQYTENGSAFLADLRLQLDNLDRATKNRNSSARQYRNLAGREAAWRTLRQQLLGTATGNALADATGAGLNTTAIAAAQITLPTANPPTEADTLADFADPYGLQYLVTQLQPWSSTASSYVTESDVEGMRAALQQWQALARDVQTAGTSAGTSQAQKTALTTLETTLASYLATGYTVPGTASTLRDAAQAVHTAVNTAAETVPELRPLRDSMAQVVTRTQDQNIATAPTNPLRNTTAQHFQYNGGKNPAMQSLYNSLVAMREKLEELKGNGDRILNDTNTYQLSATLSCTANNQKIAQYRNLVNSYVDSVLNSTNSGLAAALNSQPRLAELDAMEAGMFQAALRRDRSSAETAASPLPRYFGQGGLFSPTTGDSASIYRVLRDMVSEMGNNANRLPTLQCGTPNTTGGVSGTTMTNEQLTAAIAEANRLITINQTNNFNLTRTYPWLTALVGNNANPSYQEIITAAQAKITTDLLPHYTSYTSSYANSNLMVDIAYASYARSEEAFTTAKQNYDNTLNAIRTDFGTQLATLKATITATKASRDDIASNTGAAAGNTADALANSINAKLGTTGELASIITAKASSAAAIGTADAEINNISQVIVGGPSVQGSIRQKNQEAASQLSVSRTTAQDQALVSKNAIAGIVSTLNSLNGQQPSSILSNNTIVERFSSLKNKTVSVGGTSQSLVQKQPLAFKVYDDGGIALAGSDRQSTTGSQTTTFTDISITNAQHVRPLTGAYISVGELDANPVYTASTAATFGSNRSRNILCSTLATTDCLSTDPAVTNEFSRGQARLPGKIVGKIELQPGDLIYVDFTMRVSLPSDYQLACYTQQTASSPVLANSNYTTQAQCETAGRIGRYWARWGGYEENRQPVDAAYSFIYGGLNLNYTYFDYYGLSYRGSVGSPAQTITSSTPMLKVVTPSTYLSGFQSFTRREDLSNLKPSELSTQETKNTLLDYNFTTAIKSYIARTIRNVPSLSIAAPATLAGTPSTTDGAANIYYYDASGSTLPMANADGSRTMLPTGNVLAIVRGDVYLKDNIVYGDNTSAIMIVALKDNTGQGGNIYVDPEVTNLDGIYFAEGKVQSARDWNGNGRIDRSLATPVTITLPNRSPATFTSEVFTGSSPARQSILSNQLYIRGNIISSNTLGGSLDPTAFSCGSLTSCDMDASVGDDLLRLREFALQTPFDPLSTRASLSASTFANIMNSVPISAPVQDRPASTPLREKLSVRYDNNGSAIWLLHGLRAGGVSCSYTLAGATTCTTVADTASTLPNAPCASMGTPLDGYGIAGDTCTLPQTDYSGRLGVANASVIIDGRPRYGNLPIVRGQ